MAVPKSVKGFGKAALGVLVGLVVLKLVGKFFPQAKGLPLIGEHL